MAREEYPYELKETVSFIVSLGVHFWRTIGQVEYSNRLQAWLDKALEEMPEP